MTTNQTIDGVLVPRELLRRIAGLVPDYTCAQLDADEAELRALLDKTEADIPTSVPQGEPVALTNAQRRAADYKERQAFNDWAWNKEGEAVGRMDGQAAAIEAWHARAKLAEQPAPVAVRMCDCNQGRMPCNGKCAPTS